MLAELLIVEPKLVHEVGRHLLDLIVREGLWGKGEGFKSQLFFLTSCWIQVEARGLSRFVLLNYLLEGEVVGERALHVVVFAGRVHVVGAHLKSQSSGICLLQGPVCKNVLY